MLVGQNLGFNPIKTNPDDFFPTGKECCLLSKQIREQFGGISGIRS